ncbi:MAG: NUDIX hydrolase [Kofleriaceae bacterium]
MKPPAEHAHLSWTLAERVPAHDYGIFRTAFRDGTHPQVADRKRFSVIDTADWVNVIAMTPERSVVLVRQFRAGTAELCLEIPGGMVDPGEDPAVAVARELFEETGYRADTWSRLGVVKPNPAILSNRLHIFLAEGAYAAGPAQPEGCEVIDVELLPLPKVWRAIAEGTIDHALVVAAFAQLAVSV